MFQHVPKKNSIEKLTFEFEPERFVVEVANDRALEPQSGWFDDGRVDLYPYDRTALRLQFFTDMAGRAASFEDALIEAHHAQHCGVRVICVFDVEVGVVVRKHGENLLPFSPTRPKEPDNS